MHQFYCNKIKPEDHIDWGNLLEYYWKSLSQSIKRNTTHQDEKHINWGHLPDMWNSRIWTLLNNNVDINFSVHETFLEKPSSGTLKIEGSPVLGDHNTGIKKYSSIVF